MTYIHHAAPTKMFNMTYLETLVATPWSSYCLISKKRPHARPLSRYVPRVSAAKSTALAGAAAGGRQAGGRRRRKRTQEGRQEERRQVDALKRRAYAA